MDVPEAFVSSVKGIVKSGVASTKAFVINSFNLSNTCCASECHES